MSDPFLGEVKIVSFIFAPKGWAKCDGQFMPIAQNQALFSILGTTYGGNGVQTFALPDLRGRAPFHVGQGMTEGERGGEEAHTLTISEMPTHNHIPKGSSVAGTLLSPADNTWAVTTQNPYAPAAPNSSMDPATIGPTGGSQAHTNMQPYLVLNFIIALQGIFPSQS